jgi:2-haloacid dehalogenase
MAHSSVRAVIFDLGGVILDWNPRYVYRHYFDTPEQIDSFLAEIDFANWNLQQDKGRPFAEGVAIQSAQYPHRAELIRAYHEHWAESVVGPIAGAVEIARALKASGYPLYALSNWSAETFPIARERYDCLDLFDAILISGDVHVVKPDPRIYELMLQRIGQPAAACLLIDDSPQNVSAAEHLGFSTIVFRSAEELGEQLVEMNLLESNWRDG